MTAKKILISLSCFLTIIVLFGCKELTKDSYDFYNDIKTTDLSNERINSITIGSTEKEILEEFGTPQKVDQNDDKFKNIFYENEGLYLLFENDKLIEYRINIEKFKTDKEIKVGDKKQIVIDKYGENYYIKKDENSTEIAIGYFDKNNNLHLEFGLEKDVVIFINVVEM